MAINEEHPIDAPIGELNTVAIKLALKNEHQLALIVAQAAEDIDKWALESADGETQAELIERAKRLGSFYGYHWYADEKHFNSFIELLENGSDTIRRPGVASASEEERNEVKKRLSVVLEKVTYFAWRNLTPILFAFIVGECIGIGVFAWRAYISGGAQ